MNKGFTAVVGLVLVAACEGTAPTMSAEAAGPAFDGGVVFGSGHRSGSDSTSTNSESNNATTQESGGVVFGSGH